MFKNQSGQVRAGWLILFAFIIMFVGQMIFSFPGMFILMSVELAENSLEFHLDITEALESQPWIALLIQGGGTLGGLIATMLVWTLINKQLLRQLGFRGSIVDFLFGLFLGAISITLIFFILLFTNNIQMLNSFNEPQFSVLTISFLILFILVGFFEETFFRGYVMQTMASRGNNKWLIYIASALIFSLVHGLNPNVSLIGLINIALVGILFAYMFDVTKSLWLPIGYHITWNYFQGGIFGFAVSGVAPHGIYRISIAEGNDLLTGGAFGLEGGLLATLFIILGLFVTNIYAKGKNAASYID